MAGQLTVSVRRVSENSQTPAHVRTHAARLGAIRTIWISWVGKAREDLRKARDGTTEDGSDGIRHLLLEKARGGDMTAIRPCPLAYSHGCREERPLETVKRG